MQLQRHSTVNQEEDAHAYGQCTCRLNLSPLSPAECHTMQHMPAPRATFYKSQSCRAQASAPGGHASRHALDVPAPVPLPMESGWTGVFKLALLWHDLHAARTVKLTVSETADLATLQIECESWSCSQTSILPRGRSGCVCRDSETWHPGAREGLTKPQQCAEWSKARHT